MKTAQIRYCKYISNERHEGVTLDVTIQLNEGDNCETAYEKAKSWVDERLYHEGISTHDIRVAKAVLKNKRQHTLGEIEDAEALLLMSEKKFKTELP